MPLSIDQYNAICRTVGINQGNFTNGYQYCYRLYNAYFNNAINQLNGLTYNTVVLVFLESCPQNTANYIFGNLNNQITSRNDQYLWNIYKGFFNSNPSPNMTKQACLNALIRYQTSLNRHVPVFILDLFPFHGIKLNGQIRRNICTNISDPRLLLDVNHYIQRIGQVKKLFLFGVPYTIWNYSGGYGNGSIYINSTSNKNGLLGSFHNNNVIINIGGQTLSSTGINIWRISEGIQ